MPRYKDTLTEDEREELTKNYTKGKKPQEKEHTKSDSIYMEFQKEKIIDLE